MGDRQYVGIDFHRRRSVIVRLDADGSSLSAESAPLLAGVKAKPLRGGLRPTLTPAPPRRAPAHRPPPQTTSHDVP